MNNSVQITIQNHSSTFNNLNFLDNKLNFASTSQSFIIFWINQSYLFSILAIIIVKHWIWISQVFFCTIPSLFIIFANNNFFFFSCWFFTFCLSYFNFIPIFCICIANNSCQVTFNSAHQENRVAWCLWLRKLDFVDFAIEFGTDCWLGKHCRVANCVLNEWTCVHDAAATSI